MFNNIRNYILDGNFKMNYYDNKLNIINYIDIIVIESNKIIVTSSNKKISIKGKNLHLNKLLEQEILIAGDIKSIELE